MAKLLAKLLGEQSGSVYTENVTVKTHTPHKQACKLVINSEKEVNTWSLWSQECMNIVYFFGQNRKKKYSLVCVYYICEQSVDFSFVPVCFVT